MEADKKKPIHQMVRKMVRKLAPGVTGFLFCTSAALLALALFRQQSYSTAVPLAFIAIGVFAAAVWGSAGAVAGLVTVALLFALFLYKPFGSVTVDAESARSNLGWMLLLGLPLAFLFSKPPMVKR